MQKKTDFIFDMDGTLIDSSEGITVSVAYALDHYGIVENDLKNLHKFIGPPLQNSFMDFYGFSKEKAIEAISVYRKVFSNDMVYKNHLYKNIKEMVMDLSRTNNLYIATSKPQIFAEKIVEQWELSDYFKYVGGSELHGDSSKSYVISEVLKNTGINPENALMIGDKSHDIIGAKEHGITSLGVLFGFGSKEELTEAKADYIVKTEDELWEFLKKYDD